MLTLTDLLAARGVAATLAALEAQSVAALGRRKELMAALDEAAAESGARLDIRAHPESALAGAIGAALWGAFRARKISGLGFSLESAAAVGR